MITTPLVKPKGSIYEALTGIARKLTNLPGTLPQLTSQFMFLNFFEDFYYPSGPGGEIDTYRTLNYCDDWLRLVSPIQFAVTVVCYGRMEVEFADHTTYVIPPRSVFVQPAKLFFRIKRAADVAITMLVY